MKVRPDVRLDVSAEDVGADPWDVRGVVRRVGYGMVFSEKHVICPFHLVEDAITVICEGKNGRVVHSAPDMDLAILAFDGVLLDADDKLSELLPVLPAVGSVFSMIHEMHKVAYSQFSWRKTKKFGIKVGCFCPTGKSGTSLVSSSGVVFGMVVCGKDTASYAIPSTQVRYYAENFRRPGFRFGAVDCTFVQGGDIREMYAGRLGLCVSRSNNEKLRPRDYVTSIDGMDILEGGRLACDGIGVGCRYYMSMRDRYTMRVTRNEETMNLLVSSDHTSGEVATYVEDRYIECGNMRFVRANYLHEGVGSNVVICRSGPDYGRVLTMINDTPVTGLDTIVIEMGKGASSYHFIFDNGNIRVTHRHACHERSRHGKHRADLAGEQRGGRRAGDAPGVGDQR